LNGRQSQELATIRILHDQQQTMYKSKTNRIKDRIVSISQPHVCPIVRGKAKAATEFGAKIAVSMVDGYMYLDRLDWDSFNESVELKQAIESCKERFGYYPEAVLADKIYRNHDNRAYCKEKGIRLSEAARAST
jgi:IS5 family transposase